ncbi:MAG: hypothetical protein KZQ75_10100 [Candidatus Thiodiazotropha sp. (ex Myrtea spinifera)]|nr:hypothetical protein [Candidatus Thiodiazotropha sp. (ex Myrtea spinifera)]
MPKCEQRFIRTMSITQAEFIRSLQPLKKDYPFTVTEEEKKITISDPQIEIHLGNQININLGSLNMPSMDITFFFRDMAEQGIEDFWNRFNLCFRRGGG